MDMFTGRHQVSMAARRAAVVLMAVLITLNTVYVGGFGVQKVYADSDLPFTITETTYGIEGDGIAGSMVKITDDDAEFVKDGNDGIGVTAVKKDTGAGTRYYLISKHGLAKTFTAKDDEDFSVQLLYNETSLQYYPDELYVVSNPETGKKDIYNASSNQYITIDADDISIYANGGYSYGYYREKGLLTYGIDGKYGLLRSNGTKVCNAEYDSFELYKNCVVGENDSGCWLITENGAVAGSYSYVSTTDDDSVCRVTDKSYKSAILNMETLAPVSGFKSDYSNNNDTSSYMYRGELYFFCDTTNEIITQTGVVDLAEKYPDADFIRGGHGVGNSLIVQRDTGAANWTEEWIWLTPDGSTELKRKTFELYRADDDDSEFDDYYGDADYYEGMRIRGDRNGHYIVENSAGKNVMPGVEIDRVKMYGKYIVGTHFAEDYDDDDLYYFYNYDADKLVAKDVYFTSLNKYQVNSRDIADNELAVVMSKDSPGKFGVIDMNLSSVKFSGYKFSADGFNDRSAIFINRVHRFKDNGWVCQLSYDINDNGLDEGNEIEYVLNSNFEVIDDGYVIQDVRSGDTMKIVTRHGFIDRGAGYYSTPEGEEYVDPYVHIIDFSGRKYLNRNDLYLDGDDYESPVYMDAYPVVKYDDSNKKYFGLVTSGGQEVIPMTYSYVGNVRNGMTFWENGEESGIATAGGNIVISGEFAELYDWDSDIYKYRANMYPVISLKDREQEDTVCYIYDYKDAAGGSAAPSYEKVHKAFSTIHDHEVKTFKGKDGYYYFDSYFDKDADHYDQSLATMSLCLAFSSYGDEEHYAVYDQNAKKIMTECGFADGGRYRSYTYNEKPSRNSIGCAIGSKEIKGKTLIAVVVRSGGYEAEWASNLNIGSTNDDHSGFDVSAEKVLTNIKTYISQQHLSGDLKIWITGFSRGAAVATQTAAKLNDLSGYAYQSGSDYVRVDFDKKSIYAYGFATPAGAIKASDPHGNKYNNIFNVIDYNDPVPLVAPGKWGYDRYGTTKILPYKESSDPAKYNRFRNALISKMDGDYRVDEFASYSISPHARITDGLLFNRIPSIAVKDIWNNDSMGTFNRKLVNSLASSIGSSKKYIDEYETPITYNIGQLKEGGSLMVESLFVAAAEIIPKFAVLHPNITATLVKNNTLLANVHANQEYYVYSMQLMDPNYSDSFPLFWGDAGYRVFEANCPVDLTVFDSNGRKVAGIVNDMPETYDEENGIITSVDADGQKIAYLPAGEEYKVVVKARENCEVSCGFREYGTESGECSRAANFRTVTMKTGEELKSDVEAFTSEEREGGAPDGSSVDYSLKQNNVDVEMSGDYKGSDDIESHTYKVTTVCDEQMGEVIGGGEYIKGSYAQLTALSRKGYDFEGFYIGGTRVDQEDVEGNTIRIQVNGDVEVEARYVKGEEEDTDIKVSSISLSASPSVNIAAGKKTKLTAKVLPADAAVRTVTWKSSNTSYATVSSSGVVTTKKAGKGKSVVITATAKDGSGVKKSIRINIKKGIVTKVSLKAAKTVKAGKALKVKSTVKASKGANKKLIWKSSNTAYAKVSGGKVKALKGGKGKTVRITASATDGSGKKATVKIKIK